MIKKKIEVGCCTFFLECCCCRAVIVTANFDARYINHGTQVLSDSSNACFCNRHCRIRSPSPSKNLKHPMAMGLRFETPLLPPTGQFLSHQIIYFIFTPFFFVIFSFLSIKQHLIYFLFTFSSYIYIYFLNYGLSNITVDSLVLLLLYCNV